MATLMTCSVTVFVCACCWLAGWISLTVLVLGLLVVVGLTVRDVCVGGERLPPSGKAVLVTGCDTGFGHELAHHLDSLGMLVFAGCLHADGEGARGLKELCSENLHILQMDITSETQVNAALDTVKKHMPPSGFWGLVNNAALNLVGDIELVSMDTISSVFDVIRTTKAFLPLIRQSKGRVVNITSGRGLLATNSAGAYTMTKFAGEAFSDTLRLEMVKFGVKVVIVEPGNFSSGTGILYMPRLIKGAKDDWDKLDPGIRATYGEEYRDALLAGLEASIPSGSYDLSPVIQAITDGLLLTQPAARYFVSGGCGRIDIFRWLILLQAVLPTYLMDRVILYFCDQDAVKPQDLQK